MKKIIFCIVLAGLTLAGCKEWLDINHDPNNATKDRVSMGLFLPQCQTRIAALLNNSSNQYFLSHHLTKSGGVGGGFPFLNGLIQTQNADGFWQELYTIGSNLVIVRDKAIEVNSKAFTGIAQVLLVHNFQRLVDMFGDIPYTEAIKGIDPYQPVYDKAQDVYASLLSDLDEAIANLTAAKSAEQRLISTTYELAKFDVMAKGDMDKWIRFAYSLKLRMLMRVSGVQNVNSQVAALVNNCLTPNEVMFANPGYIKESGKMSPFYVNFGFSQTNAEQNGHAYYRPSKEFVEKLRDNKDPRLRVYVQPRLNLGADENGRANYEKWGLLNEYYIGIPYGQQDPPLDPRTSSIGLGILGLAGNMTAGPISNAPVMAGFEVQFYLAEAALNGIISGGDAAARAYYEAGVKGCFAYLEVPLKEAFTPGNGIPNHYVGVRPPITGTALQAATEYLAQDNDFCNWSLMTTTAQKLEAIATQKWISLFGVNPIEAWSEFRRLDLPFLGSSIQGQDAKNISILLYPQSEFDYNKEHTPNDGRSVYTSLLFWDKANGNTPRASDYL